MGQEREASADYPAWAPPAAPVRGWLDPQQGWGGWPPRSWRTLVRQEECGASGRGCQPRWERWARRACWVPLPCQEPKIQVNDPRRKGNSGSANLTRLNHCQREGVRPQGREETVLTSPGRWIPGSPRFESPPLPTPPHPGVWKQPSRAGAGGASQAFVGQVASSHPERRRARWVLRKCGGGGGQPLRPDRAPP
uniref:Uncharacterized protein n=1 Tax=Pipistrellus kuhlii TaxID=59472 RepID=A0A7J7TL61_PIPKU|nr:hypothetical protein mPipKuh1_009355 [Pipistrellus kuhlii]